jgi:uncharacterized protein YndB with AHSA1/START domain
MDLLDSLDRIERQIDIAAPAERVWELIARPGWFINDGAVIDNEVERVGDVDVVTDPVHGRFPIRTERLDRPRYAAFRWLSGEPGPDLGARGSTLVEFWVEDRVTGGVTLRVAESGFATLPVSEEERRRQLEENTEGWGIELLAALTYLDPRVVTRAVYVAAPAEQVWTLMTGAEHLATWYAFDGAVVEAVEGGKVELTWKEHGTFRGRVAAVDPPRSFAFDLAAAPDLDPEPGRRTRVTFTLKQSGEGCLVTVRHEGFETLTPGFGPPTTFAATEVAGWEAGLRLLAGLVAPR